MSEDIFMNLTEWESVARTLLEVRNEHDPSGLDMIQYNETS
jgi:hypothetical protein